MLMATTTKHAEVRISEKSKRDSQFFIDSINLHQVVRIGLLEHLRKKKNHDSRVGYLIYDDINDQFYLAIYHDASQRIITILTLEEARRSTWGDQIKPSKLVSAVLARDANLNVSKIISRIYPIERHQYYSFDIVIQLSSFNVIPKFKRKKFPLPTDDFITDQDGNINVYWSESLLLKIRSEVDKTKDRIINPKRVYVSHVELDGHYYGRFTPPQIEDIGIDVDEDTFYSKLRWLESA